jgi:cytochrome c biogenesis protein ResB
LAVSSRTSTITRTVRINQPLSVRGTTFHLQGYGPAVQITAPEGTFGAALGGSRAQEVHLPEVGLTLRVAHRPKDDALFVEALAASGTLLGSGSVPYGQEIEIQGTPVTFGLAQYSLWQASRDPTFAVAVASAVLLLAAIVISLWVPHRRLWIRVNDEGDARMVGAGDWAGTFDALAKEIGPEEGKGDG